MVQLTVSCSIDFFVLFLPWHRVGPFFRHGPEEQSVFVTFASAFLVKVNSNFFILFARLLIAHRNVAATTKIFFLSHSRTTR